jgi:hypothetical protein
VALAPGRPGRSWAERRGRQDHGRPHHDVRRHIGPPGPPDGARAEPAGAATGAWGPLLRSWGNCPRGSPGHRLPLVALVPQWRQDYPNNLPPTWATAISEMGHKPPPALQKKSEDAIRLPPPDCAGVAGRKFTGCYGARVVLWGAVGRLPDRELPQTGDVPKSPLPENGSLMPSAGTISI